jgi:hypothetical protein
VTGPGAAMSRSARLCHDAIARIGPWHDQAGT